MGEVRTAGGGPVPGAVLVSPGCEAVTGADGRFRVGCDRGTRSFAVTHPDHLDRTWLVNAGGSGEQDVGVVELAPIPLGEGLWLAGDGRLDPLPQAPLLRTGDKDALAWCIDAAQGAPVTVPPGRVRLLDNHGVDWRIYALDADRCAYRMTRGADGANWTYEASRVAIAATTPRSPGRDWVELDLPAGDYAIVEWYEGFLVKGEGEAWRSHWLRAGAPTIPSVGSAAADALLPEAPAARQAP